MEASAEDVVAWSIAPTDTRVGRLCTLALAGWFASIGATSATENSEILYWVASMPGVFGLFMLALAVNRRS